MFLDCNGCYLDFLRTEVAFVDYGRDRTEADVHLLITRAETGGGSIEVMKQIVREMHCPEMTIAYGLTETSPLLIGDRLYVGDWNGDGVDTPGMVSGATLY